MSASETAATEPARPRAAFIVGPTGAGKTALALEVAPALGAEIVNADSRQIYRGMDIGTAKPTAAECARVPHHLIDIRDPDDPLDVAGFAALAREAIADIQRRGRRAIVVGGSGLYLRALRGGIFKGPPRSMEIRTRLEKLAAEQGIGALRERLVAVDPEAADRIGYNDLYRTTRALEVFELTGEPISRHQARHAFAARAFHTLTLGIAPERKELYRGIERRVDEMIAAGLVAEVGRLLAAGYRPERPPLATIGYKQIAAHLRGEMTLEQATEVAKRESRRLAKRQMTWFRAEREIVWLDPARAAKQALSLLGDFFELGRAGAAA
jgi:tRNA dimethylallyltransferase